VKLLLDLSACVAGATLPYIANETAKLRGAARRSDERAHYRSLRLGSYAKGAPGDAA